MTRPLRYLACALLAVMLPIQASAAACAQICAAMQQQEAPQHDEASGGDHCQQPEKNNTKSCCQAHTFAVDMTVHVVRALPPTLEHIEFIARWTSFIPEEPSPPPIAGILLA